MTPILVFQAISDDVLQDNAPTYTTLQQTFDTALWNALAREAQSKVAGVQWAGPIRVVRKVREAHLPGGRTSATSVLVYTGAPPSILLASSIGQFTAFITGIQESIRAALQGTADATSKTVTVTATAYNPAPFGNGPLTFWSGADDATSRTRDRFPQTNALGQVSADQNENPIGPNNPALVPMDSPPIVANPITFVVGAVAVIALVYLIAPAFRGASSIAVRRVARRNPPALPKDHPDKDVRKILKVAVDQDWSLERRGATFVLKSPRGGDPIWVPMHAGGANRGLMNLRSELRKRGIAI